MGVAVGSTLMGIKDSSEFYTMTTPVHVPLRFHKDGYYRLAADMTCKGCGRRFVQVVRCNRYSTEGGIGLMTRKPDPSDEKVVAKMMLSACEHGVGRAEMHEPGCWVGAVKRTGPMVLKGMESGIGVRNRQRE